MLGIPSRGKRVQVWPAPGKKVQLGERPLDSGGRWMRASGESVIWSPFHLEQLRAGDIMLHPPACDEHDFGNRGKDGKQEHEHCRRCGRDMKAAQKHDVERAPALEAAKKAVAAQELQPRELADGEMLEAAPPPAGVTEEGSVQLDQPKDKE